MQIKAGFYIVSTPIGNLDDITLRAIEVLKNSDIIFCEDTRVSRKLLAKHNIKTPLSVYNDNSDESTRLKVMQHLDAGKVVSLISDAGTPLISDPGYKLVRMLKEQNYNVDIAPGVSAPIAALTLSGLPSDRFLFCGFLPKTLIAKKNLFEQVKSIEASIIFFDSPGRLTESLVVALDVFGDRNANVSRELTKLFQESITAKISELIDHYSAKKPKGELVLIISGKPETEFSKKILEEEIKNLLLKGQTAKSITETLFQKYHKYYTKTEIYKISNYFKRNECK